MQRFGSGSSRANPDYALSRWFKVCLLACCAGCTSIDRSAPLQQENLIVLLDPEQGLSEDWEHRRLRRGNTTYKQADSSLGSTIQVTGNKSASILVRLFDPVDPDCNRLRWSWYVDSPQPSSDLHEKATDDVAASVFVLFGDPGFFRDNPVPTLRYVWTNRQHQPGEIIAGPHHRKYVRTLVVRTGGSTDPGLVTELKHLHDDYRDAFGEIPNDGIHGIAIFTDSDDTREPIIAHYGRIELLCNVAAGSNL